MPKFSVKKPFTVLVGVVAALILGIVSIYKMQLDLLPEISLPYLMVITAYPGASPEKVEAEVCEPIESSLATINGVKNVYSVCNENYGIVELEFQDGTDIDSAMVKVSSALNSLESYLPDDCGTPSIMELGTNMLANEYLAVSMKDMPIEELSQFVDNEIVTEFAKQEGVASVTSLGLVEKSVQVELNKEKVDELNDKILASLDEDFADALEQLNDAKKQLNDSSETIRKNKQKLIDSEQDLIDGKKDLIDGQKELDDGRKELNENEQKIKDGKADMEKAIDELNKKKKETYEKLTAASAALDSLNAYKSQLTNQEADKTAFEKMISGASAAGALKSAIEGTGAPDDMAGSELPSAITDPLSQMGVDYSSMDVGDIKIALAGIESKKSEYEASLAEKEIEITVTKQIITGYETQLGNTTYADIEKGKIEAAVGFGSADAQLTMGKSTLESSEKQLESAGKSLDDAQEQIDKGWESMADGEEQLADGWKSLRDGEKQLADGWDDYNEGVKNFEKQKIEAMKKANADELLTLDTLSTLVYAQNFEMPAGYIDDENDDSWLVKVGQNFEEVDEVGDIVLCNIHRVGDIKLSDVADITVIDNSKDSYIRLGSDQAVMLAIFKSSTAGTNDVSKVCKETMEKLQEQYEGLNIMVIMDQGDYINLIVNSVLQSILIGAALAIIILALFLKDFKPTIVVAISIPLSVMVALICMYFSNISLNMLSLSGMALGIGMLVDNSVVVIENIYRLRGRGLSAPRAAVQGTKQVAGAIISSTLTTICVFLPMIYTTGMVSDLMMPMCLTIVYCLVGSLVIAMTVVPAAGSTVLKNASPKKHKWFDKMLEGYGRTLELFLKQKWIPLLAAIGLLLLSGWLVIRMGIVVIPEMTMPQLEASVSYPEDMSREECYAKTDEIIERLLEVDGLGTIGVMNGDGSALFSDVAAQNTENYDYMSFEMMTENEKAGSEEIKQVMENIEAATADLDVDFKLTSAADEMDSLTGGSGLSITLMGKDLDKLNEYSLEIMDIIGEVEGYTNISNGSEDVDQIIHLNIDKNKAMSMGLSVAQIFQEINGKIDNKKNSVTITVDGIDMDIVILDDMEPLTKENLLDYTFKVNEYDEDDDQILAEHKLSEFATATIEDGVTSVNRKNQSRYITITADVEDGYNLTLLTRELQPKLEKYDETLPLGYSLELGGEYDTVMQMIKQMALVMALGFAFIYMVMVAQFQSLLSPFIVLFTIPLAFTGGFLSLWIAGENMSVISIMGLIVLMGTVVNNGIVFVDYTNQLRKGGMKRKDALIATGKTRMRPILMTALTTILAESSLIFGDDMSAQLGRGMALVIAGGLAYATLMTLFIIPVMYDIMFKKQPLDIDVGSDNIDDIPDDAAEYMAEQGLNSVFEEEKADSKEVPDKPEKKEKNKKKKEKHKKEKAESDDKKTESEETDKSDVEEETETLDT